MFWEYFQFMSFIKEMVLLSLFAMLLVLTGFKIKGGWGASGSAVGRSICVPMRRPTVLSLLEILVDADPSQFELANSLTMCQKELFAASKPFQECVSSCE